MLLLTRRGDGIDGIDEELELVLQALGDVAWGALSTSSNSSYVVPWLAGRFPVAGRRLPGVEEIVDELVELVLSAPQSLKGPAPVCQRHPLECLVIVPTV